jgi:hypothetical protein
VEIGNGEILWKDKEQMGEPSASPRGLENIGGMKEGRKEE